MAEASETTRPTADEVFASFLRDISQPGAVVGVDFGSSTQEIAAHIVECCNGYPTLCAAVRHALVMYEHLREHGAYIPDFEFNKLRAVLSDLGEGK